MNTPVVPSMLAPAGASTSENVSVCAGMSVSLAVAVNVCGASSGVVAPACTSATAGAVFASVTVSVMAASVAATPSLTRTVNGWLPGPCDSLGVQVNTPVEPSMLAPAGASTSENVSVCAGRSASLADAVNVNAASSGIVAEAGTPDSTGAELTSFTVTVIGTSTLAIPSGRRTLRRRGPRSPLDVMLNPSVNGLALARSDASPPANPSETRTENVKLPGPCASLGVQANAPLIESMLAPTGAPASENRSGCGGW